MTGKGIGNFQQFYPPPGATRLFLGLVDGLGWANTPGCYHDNTGQFNVVVNILAPVCHADKTLEYGSVWDFDTPSATTGCRPPFTNISVTVNTITNPGCGNTFSATRTWRLDDWCVASAQCHQTVHVVDTAAPTLTVASPTNGAIFAPSFYQFMQTCCSNLRQLLCGLASSSGPLCNAKKTERKAACRGEVWTFPCNPTRVSAERALILGRRTCGFR